MKFSGKLVVVLGITMAAAWTASAATNLEKQSGWQKCTSCSSVDVAPGSFQQYVNPPSMDGSSMKFNLGGSTPYRNSLWYKGIGGTTATHLIYDLYFYITQPNNSEALEFDVNQYVGGHAYVFGHQCSPKWSHDWDVWDGAHHQWLHTGIACPVFPAYKWNHVTIEVARTSSNQLHYVAITFNGAKHYVNKYVTAPGSSWYGLSVDFQMDGDYAQHGYSTWLNKVNLNYY